MLVGRSVVRLVGWLVGRSVACLQRWGIRDVQVIQPVSRDGKTIKFGEMLKGCNAAMLKY